MRKLFLSMIVMLVATFSMNAQSVLGKWKTIDDNTGKARSIVEIYEKNGVVYGKVVEILTDKKDGKCVNCPGDRKGKPIKGLVIITGMKKDGSEYNGGKILDPTNGKEYKCILKTNGKNKLDVRGYIGVSALGRTQTWIRA